MIAFTICANNYLSEAISLGDSLIAYGFITENYFIFLADELSEDIDYKKIPYSVVKVTDSIVPDFVGLTEKYNIIELSTAVKPSVFKYLIAQHSGESIFCYLDPDLYFFQNSEKVIVSELDNHSILLTPHVLQPVPLERLPFENVFLNYGIYNLGFIALRADENSLKMLDWWEERTLKLGFADIKNGFFVDQLWMNLVPIFFGDVKITKNVGFNMAYWNMGERTLTKIDECYYVNEHVPLLFFHLSSFDFSLSRLSKKDYTPTDSVDVIMTLMTTYKQTLIKNNYSFYKKFNPVYKVTYQNHLLKSFDGNVDIKKIAAIEKIKKYLPTKILRRLANLNHIVENINGFDHN